MGFKIAWKKKKPKKPSPKQETIIKPVEQPLKVSEQPPQDDNIWYKAKPSAPPSVRPPFYKRKARKEFDHKEALKKLHPDKVILIKMEMNNGFFREFEVAEDCGSFVWKNQRYVLDMEQKYYIIERNIWAYDFHESITLPIRKKIELNPEAEAFVSKIEELHRKAINPKIPVNEIKKLVENSKIIDVENSLNPSVLRQFTESEVIKQVLQGAMLGKIFKIMFVLIIITLVLVLLDTIVSLYASGVFDAIKDMFNKK